MVVLVCLLQAYEFAMSSLLLGAGVQADRAIVKFAQICDFPKAMCASIGVLSMIVWRG